MKKLVLPGIILTLVLIFAATFGCKRSDLAENPAFDDSKWRGIDLPHD